MLKGNSIYQFLQKCLENLRKEFSELRYIKKKQNLAHVPTYINSCVPHPQSLQCGCFNVCQRRPDHSTGTYEPKFKKKGYKLHLFSFQHYSFYDFIINKARGKSGPLFSFDVHEDVRLVTDANIEKDEV